MLPGGVPIAAGANGNGVGGDAPDDLELQRPRPTEKYWSDYRDWQVRVLDAPLESPKSWGTIPRAPRRARPAALRSSSTGGARALSTARSPGGERLETRTDVFCRFRRKQHNNPLAFSYVGEREGKGR
jgi:hypothetical protein